MIHFSRPEKRVMFEPADHERSGRSGLMTFTFTSVSFMTDGKPDRSAD
jgi:hypothetical protein